jgi:hypothetical protein
MAIALINGQNYTHQQIVFNVGGVPLLSLSDITLTNATQREFSYGTSKAPVGYGDGRDEPGDLTFTLSLTDARAIIKASPEKNPNRLAPFNIPLTLLNEAKPMNISIKNVLIQSHELPSDIDNKDIKMSFTAQCSHYEIKTV